MSKEIKSFEKESNEKYRTENPITEIKKTH